MTRKTVLCASKSGQLTRQTFCAECKKLFLSCNAIKKSRDGLCYSEGKSIPNFFLHSLKTRKVECESDSEDLMFISGEVSLPTLQGVE